MNREGKRWEDDERSLSSNLSDVLSREEFEELRAEAKRSAALPSISKIAGTTGIDIDVPLNYSRKYFEKDNPAGASSLYDKFSSSRLQASRTQYANGSFGDKDNDLKSVVYPKRVETCLPEAVNEARPEDQAKQESPAKLSRKYYEEFLHWRSSSSPAKQPLEEMLWRGEQPKGYFEDTKELYVSEEELKEYTNIQFAPSKFLRYPSTVGEHQGKTPSGIENKIRQFEIGLINKTKQESPLSDKLTLADRQQPTPSQLPRGQTGLFHEHRSKLKEKLMELERVNRQLQELNEAAPETKGILTDRSKESRYQQKQQPQKVDTKVKQLKSVDRSLDVDFSKKNFQHIIQRPPLPDTQTVLSKADPTVVSAVAQIEQPPIQEQPPKQFPTMETSIQTEIKVDGCTQTGILKRQLDMAKIAELSDQQFMDFYLNNKDHLQKIGSSDQLTLLRDRYGHLTSSQSVRELLRKVLESTPSEKLQQLRPQSRKKAYDFLYDRQ